MRADGSITAACYLELQLSSVSSELRGAERTAPCKLNPYSCTDRGVPLSLPALVPVGGKQHQYFPAVSVQVGENAGEAVLQRLLDAWVGGLQVLEHVQVLLAVLKVLRQQAERLKVVELARSQEPEDEGVVCPEEADVRPRDDHVAHLLNVLVQRLRVLLQLHLGLLQGLWRETGLQVSHLVATVASVSQSVRGGKSNNQTLSNRVQRRFRVSLRFSALRLTSDGGLLLCTRNPP